MSEAQRLVKHLEATIGPDVVLEYLSGLDALARDTAYHVEAHRKRDTPIVAVSVRYQRMPTFAASFRSFNHSENHAGRFTE